ncbi:hypothetical protein OAU04_00400 [Alphaproteobacteria bacterium]|nr:hypothetical protein [Alphaproteobacteria bacterium]
MSKKIKLILTLGVIMVGALSVWLEATFADTTVAKVIAGLVIVMIVALWLFPEAGAKDNTLIK